MKKHFWAAIISILSLLVLSTFLIFSLSLKKSPNSQLILLDGNQKTMHDFLGKVLLVNFWATSCTTCVAEMPDLVAIHKKFEPKGFDTIAVAMQYDPPSYVVNFAQSRKLPFHIVIDNTGNIAKDWGDIQVTPTTFIINKNGEIVKSFVGMPDMNQLNTLIEKLLAE